MTTLVCEKKTRYVCVDVVVGRMRIGNDERQ